MDSQQIHREWASRPMDQRFTSMKALHEFCVNKKERSHERLIEMSKAELSTKNGDVFMAAKDSDKPPARLTNWSFGQAASRAGAPAAYLRSLPAEIALPPLKHSLATAHDKNKLLLRKSDSGWTVDAITSPTYGRIYDAQITGAIMEHIDLGVWKVPSASYAKNDPKRATTLYASDRDVFVALVDDQHPVEIPGKEQLFRGFIVRNSEVGGGLCEAVFFMYRFICDNRIIWGGEEVLTLKIRHTSGGPVRMLQQAAPALKAYIEAGTSKTVEKIKAARQREVATTDDDALKWIVGKKFTETAGRVALQLAAAEPGLNPRSLWGVVQGLTGYAHQEKFGDERFQLEKKASALLSVL